MSERDGIVRFKVGKDMKITGNGGLSPSNSKNCSLEGSIINRVPVFHHFISMKAKSRTDGGSIVSDTMMMSDTFNLYNHDGDDTIDENVSKHLDNVIDKLTNMINSQSIALEQALCEFRDHYQGFMYIEGDQKH